ncbi:hypothetical protein AN958_01879 [Leucoagaricus sp. SymC.cos]|nr:hypothetical protein AN958_01879 [Leucoagaricus sp. SymC.cos]
MISASSLCVYRLFMDFPISGICKETMSTDDQLEQAQRHTVSTLFSPSSIHGSNDSRPKMDPVTAVMY